MISCDNGTQQTARIGPSCISHVGRETYSNLQCSYKSKMHLQNRKKIESRPFYYSQAKLSPRSLSPSPRQRQISHSPQVRGWTMKAYFKMCCSKSTLTPTTLYSFPTFLIYIISLTLLVPADFKSFHEFKINS